MKLSSVKTNLKIKQYRYSDDRLALVAEAESGVYASKFFDLASLFHFKKEELANLFHISLKSLMRYHASKQKLNAAQSEHVLKMISLHHHGMEVFGDEDAFHRWLQKPAYGLGNKIPFKLMNTSSGLDLIINELKRIEWGDLA